jgi:hypothetical protein
LRSTDGGRRQIIPDADHAQVRKRHAVRFTDALDLKVISFLSGGEWPQQVRKVVAHGISVFAEVRDPLWIVLTRRGQPHKHAHDVFVVLARFVARLAGREHKSFGPLFPVEQCFSGLMVLGRSGPLAAKAAKRVAVEKIEPLALAKPCVHWVSSRSQCLRRAVPAFRLS